MTSTTENLQSGNQLSPSETNRIIRESMESKARWYISATLLHTTPSGVEIWNQDPNGSERPEGAEVFYIAPEALDACDQKRWAKMDAGRLNLWSPTGEYWFGLDTVTFSSRHRDVFDYLQSRQEVDTEVPPSEDAVKWTDCKWYRLSHDEAFDGVEVQSGNKKWLFAYDSAYLKTCEWGVRLLNACKAKAAEVSGKAMTPDKIDIDLMAAEHKRHSEAACEVLKACIVYAEFNKAIANMSPQELKDRVLGPRKSVLPQSVKTETQAEELGKEVGMLVIDELGGNHDTVYDALLGPEHSDPYIERGLALLKEETAANCQKFAERVEKKTHESEAAANAFSQQDNPDPLWGAWEK